MPAISSKPKRVEYYKGFLGVDPGNSGGAAIVRGTKILSSITFSLGDVTISRWFSENKHLIEFSMIEEVWSYPGQGVSSTFTFADNYGMLKGNLIRNMIAGYSGYEKVIPNKWLKGLGIATRPKGMRDAAWKARLLHQAKVFFPRQLITKAIADAVLIARYCELVRGRKE